MVGYIPKVLPRKVKGNSVVLRSEAHTGSMMPLSKTIEQRMDQSGKKVTVIDIDPMLGRYVVFREYKNKGPFLTKLHIVQKKAEMPK